MPRQMLIGMTLMLTLAVLGAGQEAPSAADSSAHSEAVPASAAPPAPAVVAQDAGKHRVTFYSPVGTLQLVGTADHAAVSLDIRFDETI